MLTQTHTGKQTEMLVQQQLTHLGLVAQRPAYDDGVDLLVHSPSSPNKVLRLQIKGRGANQSNGCFRWFQLRTTAAQRRRASEAGLPASDAYRIKVAKADYFILVSLKFSEQWVFSAAEILQLIDINSAIHGRRKDNQLGIQKEIDLDIYLGGSTLSQQLANHCNNYSPILNALMQ